MENLDLKQMTAMVKIIAEEKNLPEETILDIVETAIAAAWRKDNGDREMNVRSVLNVNTGEAYVYVSREVIEDDVAYNPSTEIHLSEAGKDAKIGDIVEEEHKVTSFSHIASQTAKQVLVSRIREAERESILAEFEDKIGTIMTGVISRVEPKLVRIDLGKASGIMPRSEQIDGEYYSVGSRIKVYIKNIEREDTRARLILSRSCAEFVEQLFRQEVPEIENGTVEICGIAREAGRRTKIAVSSTIPGVDPVGTFVGGRGVRVQAVMNEIGDHEKIDVINWSDNASEYIREALSPAEILKVEIEGDKANVFVTEDQQSIAIGRGGQNVRLATKLTGYELNIELAKIPEKKRKPNAEDILLSAVEEQSEDTPEETPEATSEDQPTATPEETPESESPSDAQEN